jgi:hypothetical protein
MHCIIYFNFKTCRAVTLGDDASLDDGFIEPDKPRDEVRQDAYPLPKDFEWSILDINDSKQVCVSIVPCLVFVTFNFTDQRSLRSIISQLR